MSVSNGDLAAKIEDLSSLVPNRLCVADSCRERRTKRDDYLPWQDYFMSSAYLAAMRSKDPNTQVGCVIVNRENRISGRRNMCEIRLVSKALRATSDARLSLMCHAEMNALFNRNCFDVRGCTLYTTHFPCNECAKMVVQSGIGQVVYLQDKHPKDAPYVASRLLLTKAKIPFRQHVPEVKKIVIDFENLAADKI
ncbi:unnamed protein product [Ixodes pacificus]